MMRRLRRARLEAAVPARMLDSHCEVGQAAAARFVRGEESPGSTGQGGG